MDWYIIYEDLKKRNWMILLILSSVSYFFLSNTMTLGVIVGGLIIIANFKIFQHTICSAFSPEGVMNRKKSSIIAKYYLRLLALGIVIYFLIKSGWVNPIGLAIGISTVVISIVTFGISWVLKKSTGEAV